jgi:hypothetical protein
MFLFCPLSAISGQGDCGRRKETRILSFGHLLLLPTSKNFIAGEKKYLVWWCMPIIPAFRQMKQEDHKFEASLGYTTRPCLKRENNKKRKKYKRNVHSHNFQKSCQCYRVPQLGVPSLQSAGGTPVTVSQQTQITRCGVFCPWLLKKP